MDTKFWGPDCWNLLHCITQNYPESPSEYSKKNYKALSDLNIYMVIFYVKN